jgi:hypothetical protein
VQSSDNLPADGATAVPRLVDIRVEFVVRSDNSALANAVERVAQEATRGACNYAAHGSSPMTHPGNSSPP